MAKTNNIIKKKSPKVFNISRPGFTLIEVLVAALIVGLGFMAAAVFNDQTMKAARKTGDASTAAFLAEAKLEDLLNLGYDEVKNSGSPEDLGKFERSWVVENDSPMKKMRTVTVTVTVKGTGGRPVSMATVIAE